jgi:hypothetical protein
MPVFPSARRLALVLPVAALSAAAIAVPGAAHAAQPAQAATAKAGVAAAKHEPVATAARRRCRAGTHAVRRNGFRFCVRNSVLRSPVSVVAPQPQPQPVQAPAPAPAPAPTIADTARAHTDEFARTVMARNPAVLNHFVFGCLPINSYSGYCDMGFVLSPGNIYDRYRVTVYIGANGANATAAYTGRFYR